MKRLTALLGGLGAALVLAACGVPTSGVIQTGEGATGLVPGFSVDLYFVSGDSLTPVPRPIYRPVDVPAAVRLLFAGPSTTDESAVGTRLPQLMPGPEVRTEGSQVIVRLPGTVAPLDSLAMRQLVCTVSGAARALQTGGAAADQVAPAGSTTVLVTASGWTRSEREQDASCSGVVRLVTAPGSTPTATRPSSPAG